MTKTFLHHCDPGHGWVEVPVADLAALGLTPRDFSKYSYISFSGRNVYLEEDGDAAKFFRAYEARHGHVADICERRYASDAFIRRLARIEPRPARCGEVA